MADPTGYVPQSYFGGFGAASNPIPGLSTSMIPGFGNLSPDLQALVQGNTGASSAAQPDQDQALQLLVDNYDQSGGQITPYIQNFGAQYGITPDVVAATSDARHKQGSNAGWDTLDFIKSLGGLVGIVGGSLALAGGLGGGAAGATGAVGDAGGAAGGFGSGSAFGGGGAIGSADALIPGGGVLAPAVSNTVAGTALADAGLPATLSGMVNSALLAPGAGVLGGVSGAVPGIIGGGSGAATGLGNVPTEIGAGAGAASNAATELGPNGLPTATGNPLGGLDAVSSGVGQLAGSAASSIPDWLKALQPYTGLIGAGLGALDSALQPNSTTTTQGGTSQSTSTSNLQLPSQLTSAAGTALDRANQLLGQGQQFAPLPYLLNHEADQLNNLGQNNAPLTSSFASGAQINPYLDSVFNAAADSTQNRLGTEFANAGQVNSPQHQQDRSQELQQLAAGIYGPGYQQQQNLQYGAQEAGVTRGLQQQDANLNRTLQGVSAALPLGQYMQQQAQAQANAPYTNLQQYIGSLGGLAPYFPGTTTQSQGTTQTGSVTQPLYNNPISSAAGGAVLGNYIGNLYSGQPQQPQQQGQNMQIQPFAQNPYAYM